MDSLVPVKPTSGWFLLVVFVEESDGQTVILAMIFLTTAWVGSMIGLVLEPPLDALKRLGNVNVCPSLTFFHQEPVQKQIIHACSQ